MCGSFIHKGGLTNKQKFEYYFKGNIYCQESFDLLRQLTPAYICSLSPSSGLSLTYSFIQGPDHLQLLFLFYKPYLCDSFHCQALVMNAPHPHLFLFLAQNETPHLLGVSILYERPYVIWG